MTPQPQLHVRRVPVRRSAAFLAAVLVISGTPLVARALGDEFDSETAPRGEVQRIEVEPATHGRYALVTQQAHRLAPGPVGLSNDPVPVPALPPGPSPSQWEALRQCESNGDYAITNPSGKYRGAYQFDRSTWNSVAERYAPNLVGVDPAAASPADQDGMAYALYTERGANPWPHCGRHLS